MNVTRPRLALLALSANSLVNLGFSDFLNLYSMVESLSLAVVDFLR